MSESFKERKVRVRRKSAKSPAKVRNGGKSELMPGVPEQKYDLKVPTIGTVINEEMLGGKVDRSAPRKTERKTRAKKS